MGFSPKLNVAGKLLTLQKNMLRVAPQLAMYALSPTLIYEEIIQHRIITWQTSCTRYKPGRQDEHGAADPQIRGWCYLKVDAGYYGGEERR